MATTACNHGRGGGGDHWSTTSDLKTQYQQAVLPQLNQVHKNGDEDEEEEEEVDQRPVTWRLNTSKLCFLSLIKYTKMATRVKRWWRRWLVINNQWLEDSMPASRAFSLLSQSLIKYTKMATRIMDTIACNHTMEKEEEEEEVINDQRLEDSMPPAGCASSLLSQA